MLKFLWTKSGEPSWEYVKFRLCRDVYHCRPSELAEEDWETIQLHLHYISAENEVKQFESEIAKKKGKKGR